MPLFLKLFHLPSEFWSPEALSYVASGIGKRLCLDAATEDRNLLNFAKVCVEISVDDELPESLDVDLGFCDVAVVRVEYPNSTL